MDTATAEAPTKFNSGVPFDDDVEGYSAQERKEIAGRDIPPGWHPIAIQKYTKLTTEDEVRWDMLRPYVSSMFSVTFKVTIDGRQFPVTHTEQILGKFQGQTVKLPTKADANKLYVPTHARLASDLQTAVKVEGNLRSVLDTALTTPLFGRFKDSDAGYTNLEKISNYLPQSRN